MLLVNHKTDNPLCQLENLLQYEVVNILAAQEEVSMKNWIVRHKSTCTYILLILTLNKLFEITPLYAFYDELVSPLDFSVGMVYVFRDFAQREIGRNVIFAMLLAGYLSYILADQSIAYASVCAFLVGEFIDWGIYTYTRKPLSERLLWSSLISSPVDSFVFLSMIGRINWMAMTVMTLAKFFGVLLVWYAWKLQTSKRISLVEA